MSSDPYPIKIVAVGDGCVGKTCVLISYTKNEFPTDYVPTIFDNYSATVKVDNKLVNLGLWDTAGQEEYNKLRVLAYTHCDVFLIVFSVVDPDSFVNARKKWLAQLQQVSPESIKIFVGNKIDLREEYQQKIKDPKKAPIRKEVARQIIEEECKAKYIECSALTQEGLKNVFDEAMRLALQAKAPKMMSKKPKPNDGKCALI